MQDDEMTWDAWLWVGAICFGLFSTGVFLVALLGIVAIGVSK